MQRTVHTISKFAAAALLGCDRRALESSRAFASGLLFQFGQFVGYANDSEAWHPRPPG